MDILWLAPLETKETISRVVYFLNVSNGLLLLSFHNSVVLQIWWSLQHCLVLWGLVYFYCQPGSGRVPELSLLNYVPLYFLLPLRSTVPRGLSSFTPAGSAYMLFVSLVLDTFCLFYKAFASFQKQLFPSSAIECPVHYAHSAFKFLKFIWNPRLDICSGLEEAWFGY